MTDKTVPMSLLEVIVKHEARATYEEVKSMAAELIALRAAKTLSESFLRDVVMLCNNQGASPESIESFDSGEKWIADLWRTANTMLAASPTPPEEQQSATTEAVTPKASATTEAALGSEQAAPKAAPGEPQDKAQRFRSLLDYDPKTGIFKWKAARGGLPANSEAGYVHTDKYGNKYRCIKIDGKIYQAQRVVFMHCFGLDLGKFEVDHIDGDTFNNAISNLRIVTHKQNSENRKLGVNNKSGYMGVSWSKKDQTWVASIKHHGKSIFLGHFANAELAHKVYEEKRAELFTHDEGRHLAHTAPAPLSECLRLLNSFEYESDEDSQAKAFFKAHINEDWFFHVKNSLERAIAAQGGKDA